MLWLFLTIQTACSPLKRFLEPRDDQTVSNPQKDFIQPRDIEKATGSFADKYIYADKTSFAQKLCERDGGRYFSVRPRRFGKSTFLRSLQRILDGSGRGIFNGTFIHQSDYSWDPYPVLHVDFGNNVVEDIRTCQGVTKEPHDLTLL